MTNRPPAKLTPKQEAFCRAVLIESDQSAAYRSVYSVAKCTTKSVNEMASRMMANVKVQSRIKELQAALDAQAVMQKQEWLERVTRVARADVRKMFDSHGNPIEITDLESNEAAAIAGFEFAEEFTKIKADGKSDAGSERVAVGYTKKYRLVDRIKALELVGKAYGYMSDESRLPAIGHLTLNQTTITIAPDESYHRMIQGG